MGDEVDLERLCAGYDHRPPSPAARQRAPIVGRVCMDQTMINVTHIPGVRQGDEVVLIGQQGRESITVEQVVQLGRIGYRQPGGWRGALLPGRVTRADREAAQKALAEVEAGNIATRQIGRLSGGQLQRVLLARALVSEPRILLLDEPTSNIDQRMESEIFDLLREFNRRMTILVVSHDIAFISQYVGRVACINRTLVCHHTDAIDGQVIQDLYGEHVRMIAHGHDHGEHGHPHD